KQHQGEPVAPVINAEQVLGAYQFASFGPANHLRGTTNWCAAFAQELNHRIGADTAEVERIGKELREVREERDDLRRRVDDFQSRSHGIKNLSVIEQLNDKLAERDALLGAIAGWTEETRAAVLEEFQDELNDSASYEWYDSAIADLMKIVEALSASAEPSAPVERDELKPCPFCGCQVTLLTGAEDIRITGAHGRSCPFLDLDVIVDGRDAWQARAALEHQP
ncbi:hypothetical protein M9Y57_29570, partial [Pseudomonas putida]|nr:hypothetical protein [Pseudomonas putida]